MRNILNQVLYSHAYKLFLHLGGWLIFAQLSYNYYQNWLAQRDLVVADNSLFTYTFLQIFFTALPVYISFFWLFPRYYLTNRYPAYFSLFILALCVSSIGKVETDASLIPITPEWLRSIGHYIVIQQYTLIIWIMVSWSQLAESWKKKHKALIEAQQAHTNAELQWLKAQIHPHFLFNVLNNIRTLVYFQSHRAETMLITLSEVMRYVLDNHDKHEIYISEEINHIKKYVALASMKARWQGKISVQTEVSSPQIQIEPLILITFVENALKHSNLDQPDAYVNIHLYTQQDEIRFCVTNTYEPGTSSNPISGIGLENVKRRLELLYPSTYTLHIDHKDGIFRVMLIINKTI